MLLKKTHYSVWNTTLVTWATFLLQYFQSRLCHCGDIAILEIGQAGLRSSAGWQTEKLHECLLNKSCEFVGLRQDSSLWFLAVALWFLLSAAESRAFTATEMVLKSSLTMVSLCRAQLLREGREALGSCWKTPRQHDSKCCCLPF